MDLFQGSTFRVLERGLSGAEMKQRSLSQNIANVDTPNYKATKVNFKDVLDEALTNKKMQAYRTHKKHIPFKGTQKEPTVTTRTNTMYSHNGNNVDIDVEMSELAKNQIYYNALIDRLNGQFNKLKLVIEGR